MSIFKNIFGLGSLARDVGGAIKDNSEVFHVNETEDMKARTENFQKALEQYQAEYGLAHAGIFGRTVDALNRLPRPIMALGTVSLFGFALYDPDRFSVRMIGLQEVPDPLWWLMGAIVSFYFGARELHYFRGLKTVKIAGQVTKQKLPLPPQNFAAKQANDEVEIEPLNHDEPIEQRPHATQSDNAAVQDWINSRKR